MASLVGTWCLSGCNWGLMKLFRAHIVPLDQPVEALAEAPPDEAPLESPEKSSEAPLVERPCRCCYYRKSHTLADGTFTIGWRWSISDQAWKWWHGDAPHAAPGVIAGALGAHFARNAPGADVYDDDYSIWRNWIDPETQSSVWAPLAVPYPKDLAPGQYMDVPLVESQKGNWGSHDYAVQDERGPWSGPWSASSSHLEPLVESETNGKMQLEPMAEPSHLEPMAESEG